MRTGSESCGSAAFRLARLLSSSLSDFAVDASLPRKVERESSAEMYSVRRSQEAAAALMLEWLWLPSWAGVRKRRRSRGSIGGAGL